MTTAGEGERLARWEGPYDHRTTSEDVERVLTDVEYMPSELGGIKWMIAIGIAAAGAIGPALERLRG